MNRDEIFRQEVRLAELTFDESPWHRFRLEPHTGGPMFHMELHPGADGRRFLTEWMTAQARHQLKELGVMQEAPGRWTLAFNFGRHGGALYTLQALARSSWSGALFDYDPTATPWPEGVRLSPDEQWLALGLVVDLYGMVLPHEDGVALLGFIAGEYKVHELLDLLSKLENGDIDPAAYLAQPSPLTGLPRPALRQGYPSLPPDRVQFLPPQPNIQLPEETEPRLFKEHWLLWMLNPPVGGHHEHGHPPV